MLTVTGLGYLPMNANSFISLTDIILRMNDFSPPVVEGSFATVLGGPITLCSTSLVCKTSTVFRVLPCHIPGLERPDRLTVF